MNEPLRNLNAFIFLSDITLPLITAAKTFARIVSMNEIDFNSGGIPL